MLLVYFFVERGLPESKSNLICFIQEVHGHYLLQRPLHTPVVVHCRYYISTFIKDIINDTE